MTTFLAYAPDVEVSEPEEQKTQAELTKTLLEIAETTFRDEQKGLRAVHAKSHGLLRAKLTVLDNLAPEYAQGLFASPATYDAYLRFSSAPGDLLPDSVSTHHGLGLKVLKVQGPRLSGDEVDTQDFLFANGKAFNAPKASAFLKNLKMLAATTDKAENLKIVLASTLRFVESGIEKAGGQSALLTSLGGHPAYHILSEEFFTQTPLRFGAYIAKFGIFPSSLAQLALKEEKVHLTSSENAHREDLKGYFEGQSATWELRAQLCTDLESMPVEKPNVAWPEDQSPYVTIATLKAEPQDSYSADLITTLDKNAAFSPWHGLEDHRPLGSINRIRKGIYEASVNFRRMHNKCPMS